MKRTVRMSNVLAKTFCGFYETLYNDELRLSNTGDNILGATVKELDDTNEILSKLEAQKEQLEKQIDTLNPFDERSDAIKKRLLGVKSLIRSLPRWDIVDRDFKQYMNNVAKEHLLITESILKEKLKGSEFEGMLSKLKLVEVHSPTYYNYMTDWLTFDVDIQEELLKKFCFDIYKEEFEKFFEDVDFKSSVVFSDIYEHFFKENDRYNPHSMVKNVEYVYDKQRGNEYYIDDYMIEFALNLLVNFKSVEMYVYEKIYELSDVVLEKYVDGVTYRYELDYDDGVYHAGNLIKDKVEVIA